jgi:hypothetical protein
VSTTSFSVLLTLKSSRDLPIEFKADSRAYSISDGAFDTAFAAAFARFMPVCWFDTLVLALSLRQDNPAIQEIRFQQHHKQAITQQMVSSTCAHLYESCELSVNNKYNSSNIGMAVIFGIMQKTHKPIEKQTRNHQTLCSISNLRLLQQFL